MTSFAKAPQSPSPAERPPLDLSDAGEWEYAGTGILAVGARDVTLAEAANPRIIARAVGEPEAVLISLKEIEADERLAWVVNRGTRLSGEEEPLYKVAWETWQEYAAQPVGARLPEWDAVGLDRSMALAEREYRFAKQALDEAGILRQRLVVLAARLGRSRRVVGETLGLSAARIQQLSESPPAGIIADVEDFVDAATRIAILIGLDPCPRDELPHPRDLGGDELDEIIDSMIATGLLEEVTAGLKLTGDGRSLLKPKDTMRKPVKSDRDRERAGDATR
jgi:hypothetical protein